MAKRKSTKAAKQKKSRSLNDEMEDIFREIDRKYPPGRKAPKTAPAGKVRKNPALDAILGAAQAMGNPRASAKQVAAAKRREIMLTEDDPEMREMMLEAVDDYEKRESTPRVKAKPATRKAKQRPRKR